MAIGFNFHWTKVKSDSNGNPRYVLHFLCCLPENIKSDYVNYTVSDKYVIAVKLMKRIGGKKFHNKQYGGGIVFQTYNIKETENRILELIR